MIDLILYQSDEIKEKKYSLKDDFKMRILSYNIGTPEVITNIIAIPYSNNYIDLTEVYGKPTYQQRTITVSVDSIEKTEIWHRYIDELYNLFHGKRVNTSNTLIFTLLPTHPHYNKINKLVSVLKLIEINQDGQELMFKGRVIDSSDTIDGIRTYTCEGVLGYLNDTIQPLMVYENVSVEAYLKSRLDRHNQMVEENKRIYIGNIIDNNILINNKDSKRMTTMNSIQDILIDQYGGYLSIREENNKNYLDYTYNCNYLNSQEIKFKKNILDLEQYITSVDLITALIPLGKKDQETDLPITIESVNNDKDYIFDEDAVLKYGWIYSTREYENISSPQVLLEKLNRIYHNLPNCHCH